MLSSDIRGRGALVSIEGLNGVGKTYLTNRLVAASAHDRPLVVEEFSQRGGGADLGRRLVHTLVTASAGERFLRAGYPRSETLLLLAVKMHDFETCRTALLSGRTVIEGRSIHTVAVYQSLILHPDDDDAARRSAQKIFDTAARWRPLPDLTALIIDDVDIATARAEYRDAITYTDEQMRLHRRAAVLFEHLAAADPDHVRVIDRRHHHSDAIIDTLTGAISAAPRRHWQANLGRSASG